MKAHHLLVVGDSGSGKSTLLRQIHKETPAPSIWVNTSGESGVSGVRAASPDGILRAVTEFDRWEDVKVNMVSHRPPLEAFADARTVAHELFDVAGRPTQILIDEAHEVLPDAAARSGAESGNPVREALHRDRDKGVKVVLATQDPQDLFYPPVKQCRNFVWVGPPSSFHKGFLSYYNLLDVDLPGLDYSYHVIRPSFPPRVVYRGKTEPRYGA